MRQTFGSYSNSVDAVSRLEQAEVDTENLECDKELGKELSREYNE